MPHNSLLYLNSDTIVLSRLINIVVYCTLFENQIDILTALFLIYLQECLLVCRRILWFWVFLCTGVISTFFKFDGNTEEKEIWKYITVVLNKCSNNIRFLTSLLHMETCYFFSNFIMGYVLKSGSIISMAF